MPDTEFVSSNPPPAGTTRQRVSAPPDASPNATAGPGPRVRASGAPLPPVDPESAEALAAGELEPLDDEDPDDLSDLGPGVLPPKTRVKAGLPNTVQALPPIGHGLIIHIVEDGFSAHGRTWYRGQEIEYVIGEQAHLDTVDRFGTSWLTFGDAEQYRKYGRVMFRRGPWPGFSYEDPRAASREAERDRTPPPLPQVMQTRNR